MQFHRQTSAVPGNLEEVPSAFNIIAEIEENTDGQKADSFLPGSKNVPLDTVHEGGSRRENTRFDNTSGEMRETGDSLSDRGAFTLLFP